MNVLVTGASGFVGKPLTRALLRSAQKVFALSSQPDKCEAGVAVWPTRAADFVDIETAWPARASVDVVVHLAARVHQQGEGARRDALVDDATLAIYRETNVTASLRVAKAAVAAGARRFVFVSSIKAMGEREPGDPAHPWRETDLAAPVDAYGITKREAEVALTAFGEKAGLEIVIVRPPLVYGPGVKANFRQLIRLAELGWPLPLGAIDAPRSMVFVGNLIDAIQTCCTHPAAAGKSFHVTDGDDVTVPSLVRKLARDLGVRSTLFNIPPACLSLAGRLLGRADQVQRLITPLRMDIHHIRRTLHWSPPFTLERGLLDTVADYRLQRERDE